MAKIGINLRGIGNFLSSPGVMFTGIMVTLFGGLAGIIIWSNQPTEEEILIDKLTSEVLSTYEDGKIYTLVNEDIVRVDEGGLTFDFHFSSGDIYVQTDPKKHYPEGQDAVFSSVTIKKFNEIARPEWINEVREVGCKIATAHLDFENFDLIEHEIMVAKDSAQGFAEMHCD